MFSLAVILFHYTFQKFEVHDDLTQTSRGGTRRQTLDSTKCEEQAQRLKGQNRRKIFLHAVISYTCRRDSVGELVNISWAQKFQASFVAAMLLSTQFSQDKSITVVYIIFMYIKGQQEGRMVVLTVRWVER